MDGSGNRGADARTVASAQRTPLPQLTISDIQQQPPISAGMNQHSRHHGFDHPVEHNLLRERKRGSQHCLKIAGGRSKTRLDKRTLSLNRQQKEVLGLLALRPVPRRSYASDAIER
jgi:hypothetical protein